MLVIDEVTLRFGAHVALDAVSLTVDDGEVVAIVGPSGSGKSSLLRIIAGLETPASGAVIRDGVDLADLAVHQRRIGIMFQDYALFPHMTVGENVAFGLEMDSRVDSSQVVASTLRWVGLDGYANRSVNSLSGGEQQRVALARTMSPDPSAVLLDEPLGALDAALRDRLLPELGARLDDIEVPAIYVTHDLAEAFSIADRIGILSQGRLIQCDTPVRLWKRPRTAFVARFLGYHTLFDTACRDGVARTPWGAIATDLEDGTHYVAVRPDAIRLDANGALLATVTAVRFDRGTHLVELECMSEPMYVASAVAPPPMGSRVQVDITADGLVAVER